LTEEKINLGWGRYAAKCALWLVWMISAVPAYMGMGQTNLPWQLRLALAIVFVGPTLAWVATVQRRLAKGDEFERDLVIKGLARGGTFGIVWIAVVHAIYVVLELIGLFEPGKVAGQATMIAVMAPMAMIMGETFIQFDRVRIAKSEDSE